MEYHRSDVRAAAVGRSIDYSSAVELIAVCFRNGLVSLSIVFEEKCRCFLIFLYSSAAVDCKSLVGDETREFGALASNCLHRARDKMISKGPRKKIILKG